MTKAKTISVPNDAHLPFHALESEVRSVVLERAAEIHTGVLALLGRQHHFVLGTPGIAKSLMVDQFLLRIAEAAGFSILMTRYSQPEEVFGGPNVKVLSETGMYERVTDLMLPQANIAFMDEIFKANSAILNALLQAMNERKFRNGGTVRTIPLHTMYSASNELAASDELAALWDRIHYRHCATGIQETSNFVKLLSLEIDPEPKPVLTMQQITDAYASVKQVQLGENIYQATRELKGQLADEKIEVTDRRWREAMMAIRAEAWFNGTMVADVQDMRPLMHFLWSDPDQMKVVRRLVLELANPLERKAAELLDSLSEAFAQYETALADADNKGVRSSLSVEIYNKVEKGKEEYMGLKKEQKSTARSSDIMDQLSSKMEDMLITIITNMGHTPPVKK